MTTIAYKNGLIAADTCISAFEDNVYVGRTYAQKLFERTLDVSDDGEGPEYRVLLASSGDVERGRLLEQTTLNTIARHLPKMPQYFANVFTDRRLIQIYTPAITEEIPEYEDDWILALVIPPGDLAPALLIGEGRALRVLPTDQHIAIGCDRFIALAAMDAGASAFRAVELSAMYGRYTGGQIHSGTVLTPGISTR